MNRTFATFATFAAFASLADSAGATCLPPDEAVSLFRADRDNPASESETFEGQRYAALAAYLEAYHSPERGDEAIVFDTGDYFRMGSTVYVLLFERGCLSGQYPVPAQIWHGRPQALGGQK
jgi:hypothetical protein